MRRTTLIKAAGGLVALGVLGVLFVRSAMSVSAEPYTVARDRLGPWTVALDAAPGESGVLLGLWPPTTLAPPLFSQLFARSGLSLSGPNPVVMPLVLKGEYDRALAGTVAPEALVELARSSGLESIQPKLRCVASRRVSRPGSTRDMFFVRFEHSSFEGFRQQVAQKASAAGGFNPQALSPIVIVAATDADFSSWLPLQDDAPEDCLAPIILQ